MELFSEIYSTYFRAMEEVLRKAQQRPLNSGEIQKIFSEKSFTESAITIFPKLQNGDWPMFKKTDAGYTSAMPSLPENPMTFLQKAWLRAILEDPRIRLFFEGDELCGLHECLRDVAPLYHQEDFYIFDKASDGDSYASFEYQSHFRMLLTAIRQRTALFIQYEGGKGHRVNGVFRPFKLEYSQKDDKFRAFCYRKTGNRRIPYTLNVGRIVSANVFNDAPHDITTPAHRLRPSQIRRIVIKITRERNALERCMVQFAHFEKRTEYDESADTYICTILYNVMDETEVVIRVLSFGPTIHVIFPDSFVQEILSRVKKQSELLFPRLND